MSNSGSSSGGDSRHVSESRQSSEEMAQELFANIEQFTKQAKKAAESLESAVEAKVTKGRHSSKDKFEEMDEVRKNVVDDFKTAFRSLGDSHESSKDSVANHAAEHKIARSSQMSDKKDEADLHSSQRLSSTASIRIPERARDNVDDADVSTPRSYHSQTSYDILSSFDMYNLASQTQDFFGGLIGNAR